MLAPLAPTCDRALAQATALAHALRRWRENDGEELPRGLASCPLCRFQRREQNEAPMAWRSARNLRRRLHQAQAETSDGSDREYERGQGYGYAGQTNRYGSGYGAGYDVDDDMHTVPHQWEGRGKFFAVASGTRYALRASPALAKRVKQRLDALDWEARRPVISVHVRHGDACIDEQAAVKGRNCSSLEEYMVAVRRLSAAYGAKSIFLATKYEFAKSILVLSELFE